MIRTKLFELIAHRENSRVEFQRDACRPDDLAKKMSALLNLEGGVILLGVEDDGRISGLTRNREAVEAWVTFTRVGSTSREATREEEGRLY